MAKASPRATGEGGLASLLLSRDQRVVASLREWCNSSPWYKCLRAMVSRASNAPALSATSLVCVEARGSWFLDIDFVQSVARVGTVVRLSLISGQEHVGRITGLNLQHLVLEGLETSSRTAIALSTIATISSDESQQGGSTFTAMAPSGSPTAMAETSPPVAPSAHSSASLAPAESSAVNPEAPKAKGVENEVTLLAGALDQAQDSSLSARRSPHPLPALVIPSDAVAQLAARELTPPSFQIGYEELLTSAGSHEVALERIEQQYSYAVRVNELAPRFGRVQRIAAEIEALLTTEPRSFAALCSAGYLRAISAEQARAVEHYFRAAEIGGGAQPRLWLETAVVAMRAEEPDVTHRALLTYFQHVPIQSDAGAWLALLALTTGDSLAQLFHLSKGGSPDEEGSVRQVLHAMYSLALSFDRQDVAEAANLALQGVEATPPTLQSIMPDVQRTHVLGTKPSAIPTSKKTAPKPAPPPPRTQAPARSSGPHRPRRPGNPYDEAKFLEHRAKDLQGAKRAYRQAIASKVNVDSAIKDLAWLTRRVDGPVAALKVLEVEFAGMLPASEALDRILVDFYMGARRFGEALPLLESMLEASLSVGQRAAILGNVCLARLALNMDATDYARERLRLLPEDKSVQRTFAIALIRRAGVEDLREAEETLVRLQTEGDPQATALLEQLQNVREGVHTDDLDRLVRSLWDERIDSVSEFCEFVLANFSEAADRIREQREFVPGDLRYLRQRAQEASGRRSRDRFDSYISAARVERELSDIGERGAQAFFEFLCRGLSALGDTLISGNHVDVARGVYAEALAVADLLDEPATEQDVWNCLVRYTRSTFEGAQASTRTHDRGGNTNWTSRQVASVLVVDMGDVPLAQAHSLFDAVTDLAGTASFASEALIGAIERSRHLAGPAIAYLEERLPEELAEGAALLEPWRALARIRTSQREEVDARVRLLRDMELREVDLARARAELDSASAHQQVTGTRADQEATTKLLVSLHKVERALKEPSFEEQEFRYREVLSAVADFPSSVRATPTRFMVRSLLPVATTVGSLLERHLERLYETSEPAPRISLALDEYTPDSRNRISVQVKIANETGRAPIEAPEIVIDTDGLEGVGVELAGITVPTLRGGDSTITRLPVQLSDDLVVSGAFSLSVELRYRTRTGAGSATSSLAVRLSSDEDFQIIAPNPFREGAAGRPVDDERMFFGRNELVVQIEDLLLKASEPGAGVAIYGQKRAGKSSIRLHLSRRLRASERFLVVDIENIGRLAPLGDDVAEGATLRNLLWEILEGANRLVLKRAHDLGSEHTFLPADVTRESFLISSAPVVDFIKFFVRYNETVAMDGEWRDRPFVVMIDEFQFVANWIAAGFIAPTFLQALKAILESRLFHLVVVGLDAMQSFIDRYPNEFGVFSKRRVNYLERTHAFELMDRPIRISGDDGESRYRERAQDQILELTGGNPFYIQRFCFELVEHMNQSKAPLATQADVDLIRDKLLEEFGTSDFDNLETSGAPAGTSWSAEAVREVLSAVAIASGDGRATLAEIQQHYGGTDLEAALMDLEAREVLTYQSGGYRILVRLYHEWLRRRMA